ncbi:hypothetical protein FS837_011843 [Tulasnella sp. UAMH 9824]|nr:hypothetical protein FS837_011843 [Tulasnella sp. UAMH 9824]
MLTSLMNLRLASRKRKSESIEPDSTNTPQPEDETPRESPAPSTVADSPSRPVKPSPRRKPRSKSLVRPVTPPPAKSPEEIALDELKGLVQSCPPKSFHSALLARLNGATPEQVASLSKLLEGLTPPPMLHCARCHQDYLEEENYDRICVIDHDDNSTEVRHNETFWGCCGASTEGQEPPAGWCFEGKHTNDRSKARYREDYEDNEEEDGLQSCEERKCHRRAKGKKQFQEVHVVITRRRGERLPPPAKKKRLS